MKVFLITLIVLGGSGLLLTLRQRPHPPDGSIGNWLSGVCSDIYYNVGEVIGMEPRGVRNNNPLNIEYQPVNHWRGQTGSDGRFAQFNDPVYGIRAGAKLIKKYMHDYGLVTVSAVINRWAPDHENPTNAYAAHVANAMGIGVDMPISTAQLPQMIAGMIQFENGKQPYSMDTIHQGVALA